MIKRSAGVPRTWRASSEPTSDVMGAAVSVSPSSAHHFCERNVISVNATPVATAPREHQRGGLSAAKSH